MSPAVPRAEFESIVEVIHTDPAWYALRVKREEVAHFGFKANLRRVICSLNGGEAYHCTLFPSQGDYFLTLSKPMRRMLGVDEGDKVSIELLKDESKYGLPMPDEFAEVLRQDVEAAGYFEAMSPGDQRLMLKLIVMGREIDARIARSLAGAELLVRSRGVFDYPAQLRAMRDAARGVIHDE